ncbi:MAG: septum formation initiator family protein [Lachnospiraceae bacterium]|nr:septum formation initiator family protein [Lachnospiraceae bacterium]
MILIALVVLLMVIVIGYKALGLKETLDANSQKEAELQQQLDDENKRAKDIEEYAKYTKTRKYVEEIAKEKLGLVHDGETVYKNESSGK